MRLEPVLHPVASLEATSIQERKDIKKKPNGKIIDISSIFKVESMSSYLRRLMSFFPRGFSFHNR